MKIICRRYISLILTLLVFVSIIAIGTVTTSAASNSLVTTDAVRLRSSAKITSDNIITTLDKGEVLTLLADSDDGWCYVSRSSGTKGYCSLDYLNAQSGSGVKITGVTTDSVYFRKGPSTDYDFIKLLDNNTKFSVVDNSEELWVKAKIGSDTGYIYRLYTELSAKLAEEEATPPTTPSTPTTPTKPDFTPQDAPDTPNWFESSAIEDLLGEDKSSENPAPLAESIELSHSVITIEQGESFTLSAYVTGGTSAQSAVTFTSSDKKIATVSENGTVKGITTGAATITACIDGSDAIATCEVTVTPSTTTPPEEPLVLSSESVTMEKGNHYSLKANLSNVTYKSSDTSIVTVSDGILSAKKKGEAQITVSTSTQSAVCKVKVTSASSGIEIYSSTATVTEGKTYYNGITSSTDATWSSSDTSIATVTNGFITAVSEGKAVITAKNSSGKKTCLVNVTSAEPVRFAYSSPNTAAPDEVITLYAVTDKNRTAVKFEVTVSGKVRTVNATDKVTDGNTVVWSGTTTISSAGTYNVTAYAKKSGGEYKTCSSACTDANTTIFVRETKNVDTETLEKRRASDSLISLLADFEGYSPCVYFDTIANNIPTLGYGKVIYIGESFYNDMTRKEAYAYLVQTVNNDGYTSAVNNYLDSYKICRNQQQFDALVSFVYNLGANILTGDTDFRDIFLATAEKTEESASSTDAYINATDVNIRSGAGTSYSKLDCLAYGTKLKLLSSKKVDGWYHVRTEDGVEGYVLGDYVTKGKLSTTAEYSLGRVNKSKFTKLMLQYHHAGPTCVNGLLYRRVDELDVFYHGEYVRNGSSNKYDYSFTCSVNSSTKI